MNEQLDKLLASVNWKEFEIGELFEIYRGKRHIAKHRVEGQVPYYSATQDNNGVSDFIDNPLFVDNDKIVISTFGDSFYASGDFTASDEMTILGHEMLNKYIGLFISQQISQNKNKFKFGYKAFTGRLVRQTILLPATPDGQPDWNFMDEYMRMVEELVRPSLGFTEHVITDKRELGDVEWGEFNMTDVFDVKDGYYNKKPPVSENGTIPFLGATAYNNGVTGFTTEDIVLQYDKVGAETKKHIHDRLYDGNCIAIVNNGSVGNVYYQHSSFTCSHDVTPVYLKEQRLNKHIALFLVKVIEKTAESFNYARKWRPVRIRKSKIILPIDLQGNPDWNFMEQYMKRIENDIMKDINIKHKQHVAVVN